MEDSTFLVAIGLLCITVLEAVALLLGIDGVMMSSVLMLIAGLVGWKGPSFIKARKDKK